MHTSMREMAEKVRRKGRNGDTVLVHINPAENRMLNKMSGGESINPDTGLPEHFKFFRVVKQILSPITEILRHPKQVFKEYGPMLATAALTAMGVPAPISLAAATVLGASQRGKGNKFAGAGKGFGQGLTYHATAPTFASKAGFSPEGFMGRMSGLNQPSLLNQLGMSSAPSSGGGIGIFGNLGQQGIGDNFLSSIMGGNSTYSNGNGSISGNLDSIFPESMRGSGGGIGNLIGNFMQNRQAQEGQQMENSNAMMQQMMGGQQQQQSGHQYFGGIGDQQHSPADYNPKGRGQQSYFPNSMNDGSSFDISNLKSRIVRKNPNLTGRKKNRYLPDEEERDSNRYAFGGHVKGKGGGMDDKIKKNLPVNSYVVRASDVSLFGDGSTGSGVKKLKQFEDSFTKSGITKEEGSKNIKAWVSNDEYVIKPKTIVALGNGDNDKGAKIMKEITENLRKHKGVKNTLPKKSKGIKEYMQGGK